MPVFGGDPVSEAVHLYSIPSQAYEDVTDEIPETSAACALSTDAEYEPLGNLKRKNIVLMNQDTSKNGTDTAAVSTASDMPVSNAGSNHNRDVKPELDSVLPEPKITLFPAECVQLGWRRTHSVGAGMINIGNTCYINSTLQALFHVPAFVNWLNSESDHLSKCTLGSGTEIGGCIICVMVKILKASQSKGGTVMNPCLIYLRLKSICRDFVHGEQEDAHEFMRYLLGSMEETYLTRYKGSDRLDSYSMETTPLNQIFGGYIRTEVTCLQCGSVSTTFQHCQDIPLDIQCASTLDDALAAYFCKECLDGESAYHCERCQRKVSATKMFSLEKPPQVLCLQLKRFSVFGKKIDKNISFSQKLDLTKFLCPQSAHRSPVPLTYQLVSVVTHDGSSVNSGHFAAIARTSSGHYCEFNDEVVHSISLSEVLDTNGYIMLYECEPHMQPQVPSTSVQSAQVEDIYSQSSVGFVNGDSITKKSEMGSVHIKKRKYSDSATSYEEMQVIVSPSFQWTKRRKVGHPDIEEYTSKHHKKQESKLKKLKKQKHKKKEKSTADASEGSETVSDEENDYETLGVSTAYRAETNGHSWVGAYKSDVTNHLTDLSHQGYGSANVTNLAGEHSSMDIEVERDHREHRKRGNNNAYDENFDKGRVKKVKHHHVDSHQRYHNYNHNKRGIVMVVFRPHYREDFVHYNTYYHPYHKQFAHSNDKYRNRNKYLNHYSERNHWRH